MSGDAATVYLNGPLRGLRAWRKHVARVDGRPAGGELVRVVDAWDNFIGWGWWHPRSQLAVRLVGRDAAPPDLDQWRERARTAARLRLDDPEIPDEVCRVVHAEGDDFPALVVDRYGPVLAAEAYTAEAARLFEELVPAFHAELGTEHWRLEFDAAAARAEGEQPFEKRSAGCPPRLQFEELGVTYEVFLDEGHKTGFFCDQRENRARLRGLVEGKEVLDVCSYTGGFALNAAAAGAASVLGIDLDEKAVEQAKRNANLNRLRDVKFTHADAFSYLRQLQRNGRQFDVVVVDPPKFIASRRAFEEGQAKYHDLNKLAIPLVKDGGRLVSCSCSGLFSPIEFQETIRRAARLRPLQILRETGAGPDHPVRIEFPEGRYLKALWMRADRGPDAGAEADDGDAAPRTRIL